MNESQRWEGDGDRASKDARDWVARLSSGNVTEAELSRFKTWRDASSENAKAFVRERRFWQQLDAVNPRSDGLGLPVPPRNVERRAFLLSGSAAAATISVIAAPRLKLLLQADYRTAAGEQSDVTLPDGTRVTLNTDSAIALRFSPDLRLVELLQGEALFDVRAAGSMPFRIAALDGCTNISGGILAVRALGDETTVTVMQGEASVSSPSSDDDPQHSRGSGIRVRADQQNRYIRGNAPAAAASIDIQQALAWRLGRVIFDGKPFADAMAELGRYVPERIVLADRSRRHDPVSAIFSIRQAADAIAALAETQGFTARRIPGVMIVVS